MPPKPWSNSWGVFVCSGLFIECEPYGSATSWFQACGSRGLSGFKIGLYGFQGLGFRARGLGCLFPQHCPVIADSAKIT